MDPPECNHPNCNSIDVALEEWNGRQKEIYFHMIVHRKDATWVSSRIFEDVDRNLISAKIEVISSKHSVDMDVILSIAESVGKKTIDLLLEELRNYLHKKYRNRSR